MSNAFIRHAIAVLKMPRSVPKFLEFANTILDSMRSNPRFASLLTKLNQLELHINELHEAQKGTKATPPTVLIITRDAKKKVVQKDLRSLRDKVQGIADDDEFHAQIIIVDAGMFVKMVKDRGKMQNTASLGVVPHSVYLTSEGQGKHNFRMSKDNENWINLEDDGTATLTVYDLDEHQDYYFQNRKVFPKKRKGPWSQSVKISL